MDSDSAGAWVTTHEVDRAMKVTLPPDGRAQTSQDFVIGIGVFLVAVTFVVGFFPQLVGVYDTGAGASESSIADRAASTILANISAEGAQNDVDRGRAVEYFRNDLSASNVRSTLTLPQTRFINVTVRTLDRNAVVTVATPSGTVRLDGGHEYSGQSALTLTRIVTVSEDPGLCNPACRLVVRVW